MAEFFPRPRHGFFSRPAVDPGTARRARLWRTAGARLAVGEEENGLVGKKGDVPRKASLSEKDRFPTGGKRRFWSVGKLGF